MAKKFYYMLSGNYEELSLAELKALIEIFEPNNKIKEYYTMICIVEHDSPNIPRKIVKRAGYVKEAGILIDIDDPYTGPSETIVGEIKDLTENATWIKSTIVKGTVEDNTAKKYVEKLSSKLGLNTKYRYGRPLRLVFSDGLVFIGLPVAVLDTRSFYQRRPSIRPFFRSIALPVQLSRALVNLSRVKPGETLLDPFMGTGSILIEAGLMGIKPLGIEIDWKIIHGARENLDFYGINATIVLGDARKIPFMDIDGIATDPPYGRAASTHGESSRTIYEEFITSAAESLKNKRYMVFMAPDHIVDLIDEFLCNAGFIITETHYMYVHGGLTRAIYVVYKP